MGEFTEKLKGAANTLAGDVKESIGKATGNEKLEAEGVLQQGKGAVQDKVGDVKGALGDKM